MDDVTAMTDELIIPNQFIANQLIDNLYISGAPPVGDSLSKSFDVLILCSYEYQPHASCFHNIEVKHVPIYDNYQSMSHNDKMTAVTAAGSVIRFHNEGKRILISCFAGLNRSGLVSVISLCAGPWKKSVDEAISIVRKARGQYAINNPHFESFLRLYCNR